MSITQKKILLLNVLFIIYSVIIYAQKPVALEAFLRKKNLAHAAVSFKAVDLSNGKTIASFNAKTALIPASNMKIVTTATILDTLGGGFRFRTPLTYDGEIRDGVLKGNLYLKGSGDPTLGSEFMIGDKENFLRDCLIALRAAGIKSIEGDVVVLDQLFGYDGVYPTWLVEDVGSYYAPGIYGVSIFDNTYRIYLQSYQPETLVKIRSIYPKIPGLQFTNELKSSKIGSDRSRIFGLSSSFEKRLSGTIPANRSSFVIKGSIPDPGLFLADYLQTFLTNHYIEITGKATTFRFAQKLPENDRTITVIRSPPLAAIARETNVKSNNHYAEHLYKKLLTFKDFNYSDYWERRGLAGASLLMDDGSGLSPTNAVSADFLTAILIYMYKKDGTVGAFYQSLPIAGKEGTVTPFLKKTPLEGKARLKSGSIAHVQSYSGYVEKGKKRYAFSLIVNNFSGKRAELREAMEKLLVDLF
ncbi:MAG: D-alanyl-D-alanine carboxypeptidase/D-alanyl-D-alanine-endopeptidase [Dysgonamonadaceae bacterium]|jgi:D-alanyl-D-alanine carboxypeptidase/D-alanyl-D-alanine-endopeptidase (penicillin-binding protein 4)|nr:D-alanyl-D-alanine carboxypeptidase/D-alanyl-D-alanine-endopeptidase [Dysgonamonadaceae bacterium]